MLPKQESSFPISGGSQALPPNVCQEGAKPSPFLLLVAKGGYKTQLG